MLEEMDAGQFTEWMAFEQVQEEAYRRAELTAKAKANVTNYKRRGH